VHMVIMAYSPRSSVRLSLSLLGWRPRHSAWQKELPRSSLTSWCFVHGQASVKNFCLVGSLCMRTLIMKLAHRKYLFNCMTY
jgi:hypothetical protein